MQCDKRYYLFLRRVISLYHTPLILDVTFRRMCHDST